MARVCAYKNCNLPCHRDPNSGIVHDYCGRTHAAAAARDNGAELREPHGICHTCRLPGCNRPVFFEYGRIHEFCCRSHADQAIEQGLHPPSQRSRQTATPSDRCALPGCSAPKWYDTATQRHFDFCGRTHAQLALQRQLVPPSFEPRAQSFPDGSIFKIFSGRPGGPEYCVYVLNNSHPKVDGVTKQFEKKWTHPTPIPKIQRVLMIRNASEVFSRYENVYKPRIAERIPGNNPNEERRFHGTKLAPTCKFGIDIDQPPCTDPACSVCSIIESGFSILHAGSNAGQVMQLRYGLGTYFSSSCSKANDYAINSQRLSPSGTTCRVMFLCKVTLGNIYKTKQERLEQDQVDQLKGHGYNSLLGLTHADGGSLNHPENVVYSASAAIPSYLIVYRV